MFALLGKLFSAPWNRRTRWTPLLQSQREFQRTLSKERSRVDRDGGLFGFIILRLVDLNAAKSKTIRLARLLHKRLRETDDKGHLGFGRIGVMLPSTGTVNTQFVLDDVLRLAKLTGLAIEGECFVYPDRNPSNSKPADSSDVETVEPVNSEAGEEAGTLNCVALASMVPKYPWWKRAVDVVGASVGLTLALPVMIGCAGLIKLSGPGPILYTQRRTGYLGAPFTIYKFRSMVVGADEMKAGLMDRNERDGPAFKMVDDPRTTMVGRLMRATGADELPQLFNVLRGDMAMVGPRPLPTHEADQCEPWQKRRIESKPGLTCFWQVMKSRNVSFENWMRMDLQYVRNSSLSLDLRLVARTISAVLLGRVGH